MPKFLVAGLVLIVVMVVVNRILSQQKAATSSTPQLTVMDGGRSMPLGNRSSGNQGIG